MRSQVLLFLGLSSALPIASSVVHAQVDCPQSYVQANGGVKYYSNAPQRSISVGDVYASAGAQYDLTARTFGAASHAYPPFAADSEVGIMAECTVIGPTPGTPVNFTANLHVTLFDYIDYGLNGFGYGSALIRENGTGNVNGTAVGGTDSYTVDIGIPLLKNAGEPFVLYLQGNSSSSNGPAGSVDASLFFAGLPPGASVTICLGSDAGGPVATKRTTWGAVKAMYR